MIAAADLFTAIRSQLDDDNSGRYTDNTAAADLPSAVNAAIRYLITVFNVAFEQKKAAPESLRELLRIKIIPVTGSGNVKKADVTDTSDDIWTIVGVEVDPEVLDMDTFSTTPAPDIFITSASKFAKRLTIEQWSESSVDPFSRGSIQTIPSEFVRTAYLGPGRYMGNNDIYIFIRPSIAFVNSNNIALWYLDNPSEVTSSSSDVEFPMSMFNFIVDKALNYISRQQGPESKLGPVTDKDVTQLISLINS